MANNDLPDLLHLIWFGFCALWLKIENLQDTFFREDVMAASNSFIKTELSEQGAQTREGDISI